MKIEFTKILNTEPKREHGNIEELKKSIKEVGLINPLTINQNYKLLAGRRRYQAIKELGYTETEVKILNSNNELFDFKVAIEENLKRKPLTDLENANAIKEYDELKRKIEGERKPGGDRQSICHSVANAIGWTEQQTAEDLGISRQAVNKAKQIANAVEEYPELAKYKGSKIFREYKVKKIKEKLSKVKILQDENIELFNQDFRNNKLKSESIDLIFTDPPYTKDNISIYEDLSNFADKVLKPTGMLICYSGSIHLYEIMTYLKKYLNYWWCGFIYLKGIHQSIMNRNIWCNTRPLLFYVKKDFIATKWISDYVVSEKPTKELYEWQQNPAPAEYYIEKLTNKNDIILDPFMGTGTFGKVAKELKRKFIGYEINKERFNISKKIIYGKT